MIFMWFIRVVGICLGQFVVVMNMIFERLNGMLRQWLVKCWFCEGLSILSSVELGLFWYELLSLFILLSRIIGFLVFVVWMFWMMWFGMVLMQVWWWFWMFDLLWVLLRVICMYLWFSDLVMFWVMEVLFMLGGLVKIRIGFLLIFLVLIFLCLVCFLCRWCMVRNFSMWFLIFLRLQWFLLSICVVFFMLRWLLECLFQGSLVIQVR